MLQNQKLSEGGKGFDDGIKEMTKQAKAQSKQGAIENLAIKTLMKKAGLQKKKAPFEDLAIKELTRRAKEQNMAAAKLTRIRRDQMIIEQKAAKQALRSLKKAQKKLVDQLRIDLKFLDQRTLRQLATNKEAMIDYMMRHGFGDATASWMQSQEEIMESIFKGIREIDPTIGPSTFNQYQFQALQIANAQTVFDDLIIADTQKHLRTALNTMAIVDDSTGVLSTLVQKMQKATGFQLSEIKTQISEFGRASTAVAAKDAGLDLYLYTGPMDGLTRGFCFHLINKVVNDQQMSKLRNNQIGSALTYAGGYNCRHSWSPVSKGYVEAADLRYATDQDIKNANRAAKG